MQTSDLRGSGCESGGQAELVCRRLRSDQTYATQTRFHQLTAPQTIPEHPGRPGGSQTLPGDV